MPSGQKDAAREAFMFRVTSLLFSLSRMPVMCCGKFHSVSHSFFSFSQFFTVFSVLRRFFFSFTQFFSVSLSFTQLYSNENMLQVCATKFYSSSEISSPVACDMWCDCFTCSPVTCGVLLFHMQLMKTPLNNAISPDKHLTLLSHPSDARDLCLVLSSLTQVVYLSLSTWNTIDSNHKWTFTVGRTKPCNNATICFMT